MSEWVSTAAAAAHFGVSERTVLRRAAAGKLESRRETTTRGVVVVVALDSADVPTGADIVRTGADTQTTLKTPEIAPEVPTGADGADRGADTTLTAHLLEENRFLRATVEQHQRSEAELRQSLREALRAMPKALTAGTPAPAQSDDQSARIEASGPQNRGGRGRDGDDQNGPKNGIEGEKTGLSYGDIADYLDDIVGANQ
jgi:hypothetical protein